MKPTTKTYKQLADEITDSGLFRLNKPSPNLPEAFANLAGKIQDEDDIDWDHNESDIDLSSLIAGAFWFYSDYHAGQSSPEYAALSMLSLIYSPSPIASGPEPDSSESTVYAALEFDHTQN